MVTFLEFLYQTRFLPDEVDQLEQHNFYQVDKFTFAREASVKGVRVFATIKAGRTVFRAKISDIEHQLPEKSRDFKHLIGAITFINDNLPK